MLAHLCKQHCLQGVGSSLFPSMRQHVLEQVGETLRTCRSLSINEEGTQVRRAVELDPEAANKTVDERSLYAAPFPYDATLENLSAFWGGVAAINGVRLRRHAVTKDFKGSIFVEFLTPEVMKEVTHILCSI